MQSHVKLSKGERHPNPTTLIKDTAHHAMLPASLLHPSCTGIQRDGKFSLIDSPLIEVSLGTSENSGILTTPCSHTGHWKGRDTLHLSPGQSCTWPVLVTMPVPNPQMYSGHQSSLPMTMLQDLSVVPPACTLQHKASLLIVGMCQCQHSMLNKLYRSIQGLSGLTIPSAFYCPSFGEVAAKLPRTLKRADSTAHQHGQAAWQPGSHIGTIKRSCRCVAYSIEH